jgi:hypothetical protein
MDRVSSLRGHIGQTWHEFAILYVFCVWAFWKAGVLLGGEDLVGPFLMSLLTVPVFIAFDQVLQGLLSITLGQKQIVHDQRAAKEPEVTDNGESAGQLSAKFIFRCFHGACGFCSWPLLLFTSSTSGAWHCLSAERQGKLCPTCLLRYFSRNDDRSIVHRCQHRTTPCRRGGRCFFAEEKPKTP